MLKSGLWEFIKGFVPGSELVSVGEISPELANTYLAIVKNRLYLDYTLWVTDPSMAERDWSDYIEGTNGEWDSVFQNFLEKQFETNAEEPVYGCTDFRATNYNPDATENDGSCIIPGCTNSQAINYNPDATEDDGSCEIAGCTDPTASNYNPDATVDDGICGMAGCMDPRAINYNPNATIPDGSCEIEGCTDYRANNFNADATIDDGICIIEGCTDPTASNYNPDATIDDGSCEYSPETIVITDFVSASTVNFSWSGYNLQAGDHLSITATGTACCSAGDDYDGPEGNGGAASSGDTVPGVSWCSLVGSLYGEGFFIGSNYQTIITENTTLYLAVNDFKSAGGDNSGGYDVTITITRSGN